MPHLFFKCENFHKLGPWVILQKWPSLPHICLGTPFRWEVEVPPIKRWSLFHRTWSLNVEIGLDLDEEIGEFTADRDWHLRPCCLSLGLEP